MRALQITRNFPPLRGGMERLNARMFESLHAQDPDSALVGPAGSGDHAPEGALVAELPARPLPYTVLASVARGIAVSRRIRPDVVVGGSGLAAPAVMAAARASNALPAVYLHGLDIIVPNHVYQAVWVPCIRRCRRIIVNSVNTRRLAIMAGIEAGRIRIVHPGTDMPVLDSGARARFRSRLGIADDTAVLLSVGRMTARKGVAEFVASVLPGVLAANPATELIIIGDEAADALHRGAGAGYARIRMAAERAGISNSVRWLGPCSESELADAYQGADLHVFPVRDIPGDVEGFGMVAIEAAAHGLATVAFDVGGVADAVVDGCNGRLVGADDHGEFARAVIETLADDGDARSARVRAFAQGFTWERFSRQMLAALED